MTLLAVLLFPVLSKWSGQGGASWSGEKKRAWSPAGGGGAITDGAILLEDGDFLMTEDGDNLAWEG
jgi:hypothetical protein